MSEFKEGGGIAEGVSKTKDIEFPVSSVKTAKKREALTGDADVEEGAKVGK
jgi:hypothetical protein